MKLYSLEREQGGSNCSFRLVTVIASGLLIQLALGSFFTFGNLTPYVISYMRNRTDDTNLRNVDALWVTSVGSVMNCFGMTAGGMVDRRFGPRISTLIGSLIFGASVLLTSLAVRTSLLFVIFSYGVVLNFGMTMAYGPPVQTAIKWMPGRTTLAAGMIVAGFGGGAIIFNQVITAYINPENLSPDEISETGDRYFTDPDLLDRVPTCFLILGACYLTMTTIGVIGLQLPPDFRKRKNNEVKQISTITHNGYSSHINGGFSSALDIQNYKGDIEKPMKDKDYGAIAVSSNIPNIMKEMTLKEAMKIAFRTRAFYILWVTLMSIDGAFQFVIGLYKAYGQTFIEDDHFLALIGSLSSIFNCLGRPFWGTVMDRFGYRIPGSIPSTGLWNWSHTQLTRHWIFYLRTRIFFLRGQVTIRCMAGLFVISSSTIMFTEHMYKAFFLLWICILYFSYCGIWAVAPSTLSKLFGPNNMAINYGFIYVGTTIAHIIGGVTGLTLKDVIGWHGLFYLSAGMGVVPFILTFFFNGKDQAGKRF